MDNVRRLHSEEDTGDGLSRRPPQDINAEMSVLGGMLLSRDAITDVTTVLQPSDYYRPAHETIHQTITAMHQRGEPADPITVADELAKHGELNRVGGASYLHTLVSSVPTAANAEYYAEIVHDRARLRRFVEATTRATQMGYAADGDVDDILATARDEIDAVTTPDTARTATAFLDWDHFFNEDFTKAPFLPGRLMTEGQQIALVGDGKAGKSLFCQEWAWRAATGQSFLGDEPRPPLRVLYIDAENGHQDIQSRMLAFGAGPGRMGELVYASFPPLPPLDTPAGGAALLAYAQQAGAQLVFLDTVSRFISGKENESDSWLALYRCTLVPLKRAGIASVRLDHFGKEKDRGARGNSAKTQDVDVVWELTAHGGGLLNLKRTHTRNGVGDGEFNIYREAERRGDYWAPGRTRHVLAAHAEGAPLVPGSPEDVAAQLDRAGVPNSAGRRRVKEECARLGISAGTTKLTAVIRLRQARDTAPSDVSPNVPYPSVTKVSGPVLDRRTGELKTPDQTCPGHTQDTSRPGDTGVCVPSPPLKRGHTGPPKPTCDACGKPLDADWASRGHTRHVTC